MSYEVHLVARVARLDAVHTDGVSVSRIARSASGWEHITFIHHTDRKTVVEQYILQHTMPTLAFIKICIVAYIWDQHVHKCGVINVLS